MELATLLVSISVLSESVDIELGIAESWAEKVLDICVSIPWTDIALSQSRLAGDSIESEASTSVLAARRASKPLLL